MSKEIEDKLDAIYDALQDVTDAIQEVADASRNRNILMQILDRKHRQ